MLDTRASAEGRICSRCNAFKSWDEFDKKSTGINGHHCHCKSCIKIGKRKWWRKKTIQSRLPNVVIPVSSDLEIVTIPLEPQDKRDLENIFRSLIFQSIIKTKGAKL